MATEKTLRNGKWRELVKIKEGAWCVEKGDHQRTLGREAGEGHNKVNGGWH